MSRRRGALAAAAIGRLDAYNHSLVHTGLKDRVVIVAASSRGIGYAVACAFAAEGSHVAMCARHEQALRVGAQKIQQTYQGTVFAQPLDVTDPDAVRAYVQAVAAKFGRIDVCVTNAGGPPSKDFLSVGLEDWNGAIAANFLSVVHFAREVIPQMQRHRWGRFITITSVTVRQPVAGLVLSNAVRAAVVGLVKSLANEFGKDGILFNNVAPGYTATDRLKELAAARSQATGVSVQEVFDGWVRESDLKRLGTPEEIAQAVVWLASDAASFITGQTLLVDGGFYRGI